MVGLLFATVTCSHRGGRTQGDFYKASALRASRSSHSWCLGWGLLQEGGSAGLEAFLAAEREQRLPEFLRKRPKYYYYYEWMRKRINQQVWQLSLASSAACQASSSSGSSAWQALPGDSTVFMLTPPPSNPACWPLQYPELPEPVMDKLLTMEANELDLILQYPQATQQTVS